AGRGEQAAAVANEGLTAEAGSTLQRAEARAIRAAVEAAGGNLSAAARSLGVSIHAIRLTVLALAVWLAASVIAIVGVIGFLGLVAPALARYCGARTTGEVVGGAAVIGGGVLFVADGLMQLLGPGFSDLAPAGAATALLGGPLLLLLLPRVRSVLTVKIAAVLPGRRLSRPGRGIMLL
ncbi:MAG: iron chelate uptake ABC transporter family permease subunit, partial [Brevundimonas sp.]